MTSGNTGRRWSSSSGLKEKFPDLDQSLSSRRDYLPICDDGEAEIEVRTPSPRKTNGSTHNDRWQPRKENHLVWGNGHISVSGPRQHGRQKSLSDAIHTIRKRSGSVSANAHELAEALKAPLSVKLVVSCPTSRFTAKLADVRLRFSALSGT